MRAIDTPIGMPHLPSPPTQRAQRRSLPDQAPQRTEGNFTQLYVCTSSTAAATMHQVTAMAEDSSRLLTNRLKNQNYHGLTFEVIKLPKDPVCVHLTATPYYRKLRWNLSVEAYTYLG